LVGSFLKHSKQTTAGQPFSSLAGPTLAMVVHLQLRRKCFNCNVHILLTIFSPGFSPTKTSPIIKRSRAFTPGINTSSLYQLVITLN
jgi:hypothetical protein